MTIKMTEKLNILAQTLVELPEHELAKYKKHTLNADLTFHEIAEMNQRVMEKIGSLEESVKLGYLSEEEALLKLIKLKEEERKNNKTAINVEFNLNKRFFGSEKAKQITKFIFTELNNSDYRKGLISQGELNNYSNNLDSYLEGLAFNSKNPNST